MQLYEYDTSNYWQNQRMNLKIMSVVKTWQKDVKSLFEMMLKAQTMKIRTTRLVQAENILNENQLNITSRTSEIQANSKKSFWERVADMLYNVREYQQCLDVIQKHFFEDEDVSLMRRKGECLMYLMRHQQASEMFARALQKCNITDSKARAEITNSQGLNFQAQREYLNAAVTFQIAMAQDQTNPLFVCNAACSFYRSGDLRKANKLYNLCFQSIRDKTAKQLPLSNMNYIRQQKQRYIKEFNAIPYAVFRQIFTDIERGQRVAARYRDSAQEKILQIERQSRQQAEFLAKSKEAQVLIQSQGNQKLSKMYEGMRDCFQDAFSKAQLNVVVAIQNQQLLIKANNIFHFGADSSKGFLFSLNYAQATSTLSFMLVAECQKQLQDANPLVILRLLVLQSQGKEKQYLEGLHARSKHQTPLKLYGEKVAHDILIKYIESGEVYNNKRPQWCKPSELVLTLLQKGKEIIRSDCGIEKNEGKQQK